MTTSFYDYVRGKTDEIPEGYDIKGLKVYRFLVYFRASQMIESCFKGLKEHLGEEVWEELICSFIRESNWSSHFYRNLKEEFQIFLQKTIDSEN